MNVRKLILFLGGNGANSNVVNSKIYTGFSHFAGFRYFFLNSLNDKEKGIILTKQKQNG